MTCNTKELQKRVYENKLSKGFNTTDIPKEFCLLYGEVAEAFEAWRKSKADFGEELADVAIYLLGIAEICKVDLGERILNKLSIIEKREYEVLENGAHIKKENEKESEESEKIDFSSAAVRDYFIDGPK